MGEPLNVLLIEDSENDALLLQRELCRGDFNPVIERVQTAESLKTVLGSQTWDVIISDYCLPSFDAPAALAIIQQSCLELPFIVVSGAIGERSAVEMMRLGAHDYLMKDNLTRLSEVVRREMRESQFRAERQRTETLLKRQQAAMEAAIDGIALLHNETFLYLNQAHLELFGYDHPDELVGKTWRTFYASEEVERFENDIMPVLECDRAWQGEAQATRKDGSTFAEGLSLTLTEDGLLICVCRDISDLKQAQEQIIHNALHDSLTGLPNRTFFLERLEHAINKSIRNRNNQYSVLFLDLDRFKLINDSLGHFVGDQLLIGISKRLINHVRNIDLVARLGGDEFVILLEDISEPELVVQITERILTDCQVPFVINGTQVFTSVSIGVVLGMNDYHQASDILRDADIAMYRAKKTEPGSYRFFNSEMHTQMYDRLRLETDLRKALEQDEFILHYQPIFDLFDNCLVGVEALVRWQHPIKGLIFPNDFVPAAEEMGLIMALDRWVLTRACQQMASWKHNFPEFSHLKVSINLSAQDLRKNQLIDDIDSALNRYGLDGNSIILEITERMLIEDVEQTIEILTQLDLRNIQISIDDFGTGYSSLNYLHRFPVNSLKIDRSFVSQMHVENRHCQVVSTIITLSDQLDLTAVAEGIETSQQLQQVKELGCRFGQGYLLSEPLGGEDITTKFLCH